MEPAVVPPIVESEKGTVVLGAGEVAVAAGVGGPMVELGNSEAVVEVLEDHGGSRGITDRRFILPDSLVGVVGAKDSAVSGREHGSHVDTVIVRVEHDGVLVSVYPTLVARLGGGPPVRGQAPVAPAVVGTEEVHAPSPYDIRVRRVDRDHIAVPAHWDPRVRIAPPAVHIG